MWSKFSYVNTLGAKGGDQITLVASGLRQTPGLYKCAFQGMETDFVRELNSNATTASSSIAVACTAPIWGDHFRAMNTTMRLFEVSAADDARTMITKYGVSDYDTGVPEVGVGKQAGFDFLADSFGKLSVQMFSHSFNSLP